MAAPIYNPLIPCVHPIPGGFFPGAMVRVQGQTTPGAQRFAINLQCGPNTDPRDDIALHLNIRFPEMCVVRNHLSAMNWGTEDIHGGMPLRPGGPFEFLLLCEQMCIKVAVNGQHFCEFTHRLPFQRISHITVDGDVSIQMISFEGTQQPQQYGAPPQYGGFPQGAPQQEDIKSDGLVPPVTSFVPLDKPPLPELSPYAYTSPPPPPLSNSKNDIPPELFYKRIPYGGPPMGGPGPVMPPQVGMMPPQYAGMPPQGAMMPPQQYGPPPGGMPPPMGMPPQGVMQQQQQGRGRGGFFGRTAAAAAGGLGLGTLGGYFLGSYLAQPSQDGGDVDSVQTVDFADDFGSADDDFME